MVAGKRSRFPRMRCRVPGMRGMVHGKRDRVPGKRDRVPEMRGRVPGKRGRVPGMKDRVPGKRHGSWKGAWLLEREAGFLEIKAWFLESVAGFLERAADQYLVIYLSCCFYHRYVAVHLNQHRTGIVSRRMLTGILRMRFAGLWTCSTCV